jgi:hypothetical protein
MANVIAQYGKPALVMSHNKTLAAQLYAEFRDPGGAALRGVPRVLSAQRSPLLRQLLRLLPARGLYPPAGHLHRKGRLDQRGDRAAAAGLHERTGQSR